MKRGGSARLLRTLILPLVLVSSAVVILAWPRAIPSGADPGTVAGRAGLRIQLESDEASAPAVADELAAQIQAMRGDDREAPVFHTHTDGSVSADLGRRFMKMSVATVDEQGRVHTSCVDSGETSVDTSTVTGTER